MITDDTFLSFLQCRRKAFLKAAGTPGEPHDIEGVRLDLERAYRPRALEGVLASYPEADVLRDPPSLQEALQAGPRVLVNAVAETGNLRAHIQVAERVEGAGGPVYAPVVFASGEKVTRADRLLLAFHASALSLVQGAVPAVGKVVHGGGYRVLKVKLGRLVEEARGLVAEMEKDAAAAGTAPTLTLNRYCHACEFRRACQAVAEAADDLSLLRGLSEKEVVQYRARGITTVTQLSHSYRPGKRGKRREGKARRHDPALQALALREGKVYVMDRPPLSSSGVALYLDVEGVPERDFCYLVGLLVAKDGCCTAYSFWADGPEGEKAAWDGCARVLAGFAAYTLFHYGQYERRFLERMRSLADTEGAALIDQVLARSCNVLAAIHSHVYFPTRSNGLKDVAAFLGFRWSAEGASGLQSLAWRLAWEAGRDEPLKEKLLTYNREDCEALRRVTEFLLAACYKDEAGPAEGQPPVAPAESIRQPGKFRFGKPSFFCPELEHINRCAYSDYQRERVFVRTSPAVRKSLRRTERVKRKRLRVNEEVECGRPQRCPECGSEQVHSFASRRCSKMVYDLKYTTSGVKRWLVRYSSLRYRCWGCKATFNADAYRAAGRKVGHNLSAWAVYHHVALRQSHEDVALSLNEIFGFSFGQTVVFKIKQRMAALYGATYRGLKDKLRRGHLIHADETKAQVKWHNGYVWGFSNLEEVVYAYSRTRDGTVLEDVLDGFKGVLVSDFYSVYDSPKCPQQKCLIHLMRDVNDDLFHHPFDEELKGLARGLVGVLKPIIDTIDTYGLRRRHLHKHRKDVDRFFRDLAGEEPRSEVVLKYRKRLLKYQDKLFVFLDHDGVPWNNNGAENALKRFAARRKLIGPSFTEAGLRDYLVFLSIYQTCRNKGVSFFRFLRSGELDLDTFVEGKGARR